MLSSRLALRSNTDDVGGWAIYKTGRMVGQLVDSLFAFDKGVVLVVGWMDIVSGAALFIQQEIKSALILESAC